MYCSQCGKKNTDDSLFCSECGKPLSSLQPNGCIQYDLSVSQPHTLHVTNFQTGYNQQNLVVQPINNVQRPKKKSSFLKKFLITMSVLFLCFVMLIVIVAITGDGLEEGNTANKPYGFEQDYSTGDTVVLPIGAAGEYQADALTIIVEDETLLYSSEFSVTPLTYNNASIDLDLMTDVYVLTANEVPQKNVIVKIPIPEGEDTSTIMAGVTKLSLTKYDDTPVKSVDYRPICIEGNHALVTLYPDDFIASTYEAVASQSQFSFVQAYASSNPSLQYSSTVSLFGTRTSQLEGGHFILHATRFLIEPDSEYLLNKFEEVYNHFKDLGYSTDGRTDWPFAINVKWMKASTSALFERGFFSNSETISLNKHEVLSKSLDLTVPVFAHEWFHFLQSNYYTNQSTDFEHWNLWFDEATATYIEKMYGGGYSDVATESFLHQFNGPFPMDGSNASQGYGRLDLISFLASRYGEPFILKAYQTIAMGVDSKQAIITATEPVPVWIDTYYMSILDTHSEASIWNSVRDQSPGPGNDMSYGDIGYRLDINIPQQINDKPLIEKSIALPSYGARVYPLEISGQGLNDSAKLSISANNLAAHVILYKIGQIPLTNNSNSLSISNLKTENDSNTRYMLLVVNQSETDINTTIIASVRSEEQTNATTPIQSTDQMVDATQTNTNQIINPPEAREENTFVLSEVVLTPFASQDGKTIYNMTETSMNFSNDFESDGSAYRTEGVITWDAFPNRLVCGETYLFGASGAIQSSKPDHLHGLGLWFEGYLGERNGYIRLLESTGHQDYVSYGLFLIETGKAPEGNAKYEIRMPNADQLGNLDTFTIIVRVNYENAEVRFRYKLENEL